MTPEPRRPRRPGWPWPAPQASIDDHALAEAHDLVTIAALAVTELTEALQSALRRLEEVQLEAGLTSASVAAREADDAIAHARRRDT